MDGDSVGGVFSVIGSFGCVVKTIGDLRKAIEGLPDDMVVGVSYDGCSGGSYCESFEKADRWIEDFPVFWVCDCGDDL